MRVAVTGSSGFVGEALCPALAAAGHAVVRLVRDERGGAGTARWDPASGRLDTAALGAVDAVVHLAGENVAAGRWTGARKRAIGESRGPATLSLCRSLAALPTPPRVFVGASATGIYGDRGDELLHDDSPTGDDFLARVAVAWEAGAAPLAEVGARVVHPRIGMVLDPAGGALQRMRLPFRLGVGGRLGSGRQWISWSTRHDLVRALLHLLDDASLRGPVLVTTPTPVTNAAFTAALGRALHRPTLLPAPAFALRLVFGELADAVLLASQRAEPRRLTAAGFAFEHATIDAALAALL
ncbi:MAG: TIGR01777 family protein [Planctomycetes bacterium]|nr:TIGR01777 family protein [Planctomycetota bacterium]